MRSIFAYLSMTKKAVLQYIRELNFFLRAKSHYILDRSCKTNPALLLRKRTHHLERYLFAPDSYSPQFAESVYNDIKKVLSCGDMIPPAQRKWSEKIVSEYEATIGQNLKTLCPMQLNNTARRQSPITPETMLNLMQQRRSRRIFVNTPLTDPEKNAICQAAQSAPSSCNRQTLYLIFVEEREQKEFIASTVPGGHQFFSAAPCIVLLVSDAGDYRYPEERTIPFIDGAAATENICLLCETMGLGCCWASYSSFSCINHEKDVRKRLKIPGTHLIVSSLAIGKSDQFVCDIPRDLPKNRFWNDYYGNR